MLYQNYSTFTKVRPPPKVRHQAIIHCLKHFPGRLCSVVVTSRTNNREFAVRRDPDAEILYHLKRA